MKSGPRQHQLVTSGRTTAVPSRIVHFDFQEGAEWFLSFGYAADVAALVEEPLIDVPRRATVFKSV